MIHIRSLRWDDWNIAHIARRQVTPEEAEEVCHGEFLLVQGKKRWIILLGPTADGRMLVLVLEHEGDGDCYPITARPASRKERAWYRQTLEKE